MDCKVPTAPACACLAALLIKHLVMGGWVQTIEGSRMRVSPKRVISKPAPDIPRVLGTIGAICNNAYSYSTSSNNNARSGDLHYALKSRYTLWDSRVASLEPGLGIHSNLKQANLASRADVLQSNARVVAHAVEDGVLPHEQSLWQIELGDIPGVHDKNAVVADDGPQAMSDAKDSAIPELACDSVLDVPICLVVDGRW